MPDFLRPAVYPMLMACIIGSVWLMARSANQIDRDARAMDEPLRRSPHNTMNLRTTTRPTDDMGLAGLDPD